IDAACDRFERQWQAGRYPRIETALAGMPAVSHPALVRELLALELAYRRRAGEHPAAEEYHQRFAEHGAAIAEAFATVPEHSLGSLDPAATISTSLDAAAEHAGAILTSVGAATSAEGRFRILRFHDRGALGELYVARDEELKREVVLKQIRDEHA